MKGLEQRLADGERVLCAEGYLLALARMGYIAHGVWVPEFILEQPEVLRNVHYEFVHAGSDVTEAFQVTIIVVLYMYNELSPDVCVTTSILGNL